MSHILDHMKFQSSHIEQCILHSAPYNNHILTPSRGMLYFSMYSCIMHTLITMISLKKKRQQPLHTQAQRKKKKHCKLSGHKVPSGTFFLFWLAMPIEVSLHPRFGHGHQAPAVTPPFSPWAAPGGPGWLQVGVLWEKNLRLEIPKSSPPT